MMYIFIKIVIVSSQAHPLSYKKKRHIDTNPTPINAQYLPLACNPTKAATTTTKFVKCETFFCYFVTLIKQFIKEIFRLRP